MATLNLTLDTRRAKKDKTFPIKLIIRHNNKMASINTGISIPEKYWNDGQIKKGCPDIKNLKLTNKKLSTLFNEADDHLEYLEKRRRLPYMKASQIADYIKNGGNEFGENANFLEYLECYLPKIENTGTRDRYENTLKILKDYSNNSLFFDEINKPWLNRFKEWRLEKAADATANIDLRNIRAVFNRAIDVDEIIDQNLYPFRKFEFAKKTPRNLRMPIEAIRLIRDFKTDNKHISLAQDFFMLSFYLIGMNNSDIYEIATIEDGRIEYDRHKTLKRYTIKVENEALDIITKRKGENKLLVYQERYANFKNLTKQINKHLKSLANAINNELTENKEKPIIPDDLKMYHARHTWAGIAAKKPIGASKHMIAQALGHGKRTVTDDYFDYDNELVDDLNRQVLDLLKQKKGDNQ